MNYISNIWSLLALWCVACLGFATVASAASRHSPGSQFPSYTGRVMCGYQGWFRAVGDGSGEGWVHYCTQGKFDAEHLKVDLWPDVSEYAKTYPAQFLNKDGTPARVFTSWDESTVELHFRWMQDYGIDGAFMQRFFDVTRSVQSRRAGRVILGHALKASQKHGRALAVMYDLSGLRPGDDCSSVIQDWKELVDELKLTSQGTNQTYLYHRGKPLVAIWGLGFPDRPYQLQDIGIEKLIDFLKHDPDYGGCSVMLGVPTYFRELKQDCVSDPYLHEIINRADVVMPWMVQRFSSLDPKELTRYDAHLKADLAWCLERKLDYAPCVFPGFSWYNLSRQEFGGRHGLNQTPRQGGGFYWHQMTTAIRSGAKMIYVAMFDELDEGTAIFKCVSEPPTPNPPGKLLGYEAVPSDHYLWLTGQAARLLRAEIPVNEQLYRQINHQRTFAEKQP